VESIKEDRREIIGGEGKKNTFPKERVKECSGLSVICVVKVKKCF